MPTIVREVYDMAMCHNLFEDRDSNSSKEEEGAIESYRSVP